MLSLLTLALFGVLTEDTPAPAPSDATVRPAAAVAADSVVTAAFTPSIDTKAAAQKATPTSPPAPPTTTGLDWTNLVAPGLALLGLAGLAVGLSRRRQGGPRSIRVVESAGLGPKRALIIADVLDERLVLAVSEAGVSVLSTRPVPAVAPAVVAAEPIIPGMPVELSTPARVFSNEPKRMGFFDRLLGRTPKPRFDELLSDSIEDQELRAKLAAGLRGSVS